MASREPLPQLHDYAGLLGYPKGFCERPKPSASKAVDAVISSYDAHVLSRRFLTGILFSFIGLVEDVLDQVGADSLSNALAVYPPLTQLPGGKRLNTPTIAGPKRRAGVRTFYNRAETVIRDRLRRRDYPKCAPHATQAWSQHREELLTIFSMSPGERLVLAERLWDRALAMRSFRVRSAAGITQRPFSKLLESFPNTQRGEPPGAVLQALAFAYYRADAPNVTLDSGKAQSGSSRSGRIGDIDGWSGASLVLTVEVKDRHIDVENMEAELGPFIGNLDEWPDATAIVLVSSCTPEAKENLRAQNVLVIERLTMLRNVELWDLRKQQLAMREFVYFLNRIQENSSLISRFDAFVEEHRLRLE